MHAVSTIRRTRSLLFILVLILFSGSASVPAQPAKEYTPAAGEMAATIAVSMVGRPYKYRGESPAGFDCSGLVRYSYLAAGLDVPHGTGELRNATSALGGRKMQRGDLLFFSEKGKKYSHVGIYLGNSLFVHATSNGQLVRKDSIGDTYWEKSFLEARRFN